MSTGDPRRCGTSIEGEPETCSLPAGHHDPHMSANVIAWQRALGGSTPVSEEPARCSSKIAHETAVIVQCLLGVGHATPQHRSGFGGQFVWLADDDRIIAPPVGSAPLSEEPAGQDPRPAPDRLTSLLFNTITRAIPHDRFLMLSERMDVAVAVRVLIEEQLGFSAAWNAGDAHGYARGRRQAAEAIRSADTSGWQGGRQSEVDDCQERAAQLAEGGPWEPAEQPEDDPLWAAEQAKRAKLAPLADFVVRTADEQAEPRTRPRMTDGCGPEHTYRGSCELRPEDGAR